MISATAASSCPTRRAPVTSILAAASTIALTAQVNAQSAEEERKRYEAGARIAASYGIDPVQFGVMVVLNLIIGTVTPPVGVVLFVVTRIAEIRFEVMARAILPWLIPLLVVLAAITLWPPLTLWLPTAMKG